MNRTSRRSVQSAIALACFILPHGGCGDLAKMGMKGALQKVGAKVVEGTSDEALRNMFEQANAACPTRMDAFTTLEEVEMVDDTRVEFRYLVNDAGKKLASRLDKRAMRKAAVDHMKGNPMAVAIADRDLSIEHIYEDSAGNQILSYTINRAVLDGDLDPIGTERSNPFDVTTVKADAESSVVLHDLEEETTEEEATLPQDLSPAHSTDNPTGLRSNPFFNTPVQTAGESAS